MCQRETGSDILLILHVSSRIVLTPIFDVEIQYIYFLGDEIFVELRSPTKNLQK